MPKSVNKVILVGNVGKDPEVKYTPNPIVGRLRKPKTLPLR